MATAEARCARIAKDKPATPISVPFEDSADDSERYRALVRPEGDGSKGRPVLDETEIREFLTTEYPRLVNGLALVCGSWALAEEAVQEALARAWERSERGLHIESPPAWVATVAGNLLRDGFRRFMVERRVRRRLGEQAERAAAESGLAEERGVDVGQALAALPWRQREVAVYRYYLDLEVAEIALRMGIPEGTVKSALHRARRSLAQSLGDNETREVTDVRG